MAPPKKKPSKDKDCDCDKFSPEQAQPMPERQPPGGTRVIGNAEIEPQFQFARTAPDGYLQTGGAEPQDYPRVSTDPDGTMRIGGGGALADPGWMERLYDMIYGPDAPPQPPTRKER
jgi:hypothetical protein